MQHKLNSKRPRGER